VTRGYRRAFNAAEKERDHGPWRRVIVDPDDQPSGDREGVEPVDISAEAAPIRPVLVAVVLEHDAESPEHQIPVRRTAVGELDRAVGLRLGETRAEDEETQAGLAVGCAAQAQVSARPHHGSRSTASSIPGDRGFQLRLRGERLGPTQQTVACSHQVVAGHRRSQLAPRVCGREHRQFLSEADVGCRGDAMADDAPPVGLPARSADVKAGIARHSRRQRQAPQPRRGDVAEVLPGRHLRGVGPAAFEQAVGRPDRAHTVEWSMKITRTQP
jgi:hypothetical protein